MKKIVFGITSLGFGGAERVLIDVVNNLASKYDITIFTLYGNGEFLKQIDEKITVKTIYTEKYSELGLLIRKKISLQMFSSSLRKRLYDKYIKGKYDVEIAFLEGPITWMFSTPSDAIKIAWVHNDIERIFGEGRKARLKKRLNKKAYDNYNKIIFVSKDNKQKFEEMFPNNNVSKSIIKNYINKKIVVNKSKEKIDDMSNDLPSFVQVSRLVDQKGVYRLLSVHRELIDEGFAHRIYVVGGGPLKDDLSKKIEQYDLTDTFILLGEKDNPYPYIKSADYFMLTSLYEGYGMVVVEAEILNKYIMITDTAAREALEGYKNDVVVDNSFDGIFDGIKKILRDKPTVDEDCNYNNDDIIDDITSLLEGEL